MTATEDLFVPNWMNVLDVCMRWWMEDKYCYCFVKIVYCLYIFNWWHLYIYTLVTSKSQKLSVYSDFVIVMFMLFWMTRFLFYIGLFEVYQWLWCLWYFEVQISSFRVYFKTLNLCLWGKFKSDFVIASCLFLPSAKIKSFFFQKQHWKT